LAKQPQNGDRPAEDFRQDLEKAVDQEDKAAAMKDIRILEERQDGGAAVSAIRFHGVKCRWIFQT
jgi:hypothetical protein